MNLKYDILNELMIIDVIQAASNTLSNTVQTSYDTMNVS